MSSGTARKEIHDLLIAEKWSVKTTPNTITAQTPQGGRREISIAFHEQGSVITGFTVQPRPFNKGTQVQALPLPRRASALKFIRGQA